ncbi:penicillin-binding transpeptidase domain-containing protein, partial [Klebsiella pneumoniae]
MRQKAASSLTLQQCRKYDGGHITYTAGVAPASRPEVALVVVINNPKAGQHFGGSVAAPVFGQIIGPVLT